MKQDNKRTKKQHVSFNARTYATGYTRITSALVFAPISCSSKQHSFAAMPESKTVSIRICQEGHANALAINKGSTQIAVAGRSCKSQMFFVW